MFKLLKRLSSLYRTDERVDAINAESRAIIKDAGKAAKRHRDLLRKDGITLQIYIATGGDHRHA